MSNNYRICIESSVVETFLRRVKISIKVILLILGVVFGLGLLVSGSVITAFKISCIFSIVIAVIVVFFTVLFVVIYKIIELLSTW